MFIFKFGRFWASSESGKSMKFLTGYEDSSDGIWRMGRGYGKATVVSGFGMNPYGVLGG